jgi:hypothetical protein
MVRGADLKFVSSIMNNLCSAKQKLWHDSFMQLKLQSHLDFRNSVTVHIFKRDLHKQGITEWTVAVLTTCLEGRRPTWDTENRSASSCVLIIFGRSKFITLFTMDARWTVSWGKGIYYTPLYCAVLKMHFDTVRTSTPKRPVFYFPSGFWLKRLSRLIWSP